MIYDIGIIYITKKYSSILNKYEFIFKLNNKLYKIKNNETLKYLKSIPIFIFYDYFDKKDILTQVIYNKQTKTSLNELLQINEFNKYIDNCTTNECDQLKIIRNFIN